MTVAKSPYDLANAILKDAGVSLSQMRAGDYDRIVKAMETGVFDIGFKKSGDGKFDVLIDGHSNAAQTSSRPDGCPEWMPVSLCGGYGALSKFAKYGTIGGTVANVAELTGVTDDASSLMDSLYIRIGLFVLGVLLVGIAVVFLFKDSALETAVPLIKTIKKAGQ